MNKSVPRVGIANRGEVACRVIRACRELGWESALLHSEADSQSRAFREADHCELIGPSPTAESYLNHERVIAAAKRASCTLLHPGFGFLSENADFAQAVANAGMIFVGPSPQSIRDLGDKMSAKTRAESLGLPTIPGYRGADQSIPRLVAEAEKIGFPVVVKAAAGGGGRGMKVLRSKSEAPELLQSAQREGQSAFGSPLVFLEKYFERAKHIEFQIFGDSHGKVVSLLDRECSVQRRHQKIVEEALSPSLTPELRDQMSRAAVKLAESARYQGAGTVEFLLQDGQFYFLEMNTRLQVEHPVTEEVLGVDLVQAQLRTAVGEFTNWSEADLKPTGHAIECRLYAEDPFTGGLPSTGLIWSAQWPCGPGVRLEIGLDPGDEVTSHYDSMIAKLIVTGRDRREAMQRTLQALHQTQVAGVHLNLAFLDRILSHAEFQSGAMTTQFIGQHFPEGLTERRAKAPEGDHLRRLVFENLKAQQALGQPTSFAAATPISSSGWPRFVRHSSGEWTCRRGNQLWVMSAAESTLVSLASGALDASRTGAATGQVVAPMPGKIVKVLSKPGQTVEPNQTLLVMEAMKMEYTIKAPLRAQLEKIRVTEGQMVALGEQLADLKPLKER